MTDKMLSEMGERDMGRNGNGTKQGRRMARVVTTAIATTMLVTATTPSVARADIIWNDSWETRREREARRRNQWRNQQVREQQDQSDNVPDMTDSNTAWSIPTGIPVGWTEPILAVTGTLLAGGMTVWVLRRNGERDGRKGQ